MVDDSASTLIPPISFGLTRTFHESAEMNALKSKLVLINDNNSSSTIGCDCMDYKSQFGLESEYCNRFELNRSISLTLNSLELGSQVPSGDIILN